MSPDRNRCLQSQRHMAHIETLETDHREHTCRCCMPHNQSPHHSHHPECPLYTLARTYPCLSMAWRDHYRHRTDPDSSTSCSSRSQQQRTPQHCSRRTESCCQSRDPHDPHRTGCSCRLEAVTSATDGRRHNLFQSRSPRPVRQPCKGAHRGTDSVPPLPRRSDCCSRCIVAPHVGSPTRCTTLEVIANQ